VSAGDIVMNERLEHWAKGTVRVQLPVLGVFTITDNKIVRWCDYFDAGTVKPLIEAMQQK
jgi:limonene-1,2-epoxide hydrolase